MGNIRKLVTADGQGKGQAKKEDLSLHFKLILGTETAYNNQNQDQ